MIRENSVEIENIVSELWVEDFQGNGLVHRNVFSADFENVRALILQETKVQNS